MKATAPSWPPVPRVMAPGAKNPTLLETVEAEEEKKYFRERKVKVADHHHQQARVG